jgi:hypothetical protein
MFSSPIHAPDRYARVPYIVGNWVRNGDHYGRHSLLENLLTTSNTAIWVLAARRMGKTSLLRQLELLANRMSGDLIPLFVDLQGCDGSAALSTELFFALDAVRIRLAPLGIDVDALDGQDAVQQLRHVSRLAAAAGKRFLLLVDEAEVLLHLAQTEPVWLARLRKTLQDGSLRTIIASTKLLSQLNDLTADWATSPFLFGFSLVNLWQLERQEAEALVCLRQTGRPLAVEPAVLEEILAATACHPYLIQHLCAKLYGVDEAGRPRLRQPAAEDYLPDQILDGIFGVDFYHMSALERRILLAVAARSVVAEEELLTMLVDENPARIRMFVWGLEKRGYLRRIAGLWAPGNEFFAHWLEGNLAKLGRHVESAVSDNALEDLLHAGNCGAVRPNQPEIATLAARQTELWALRDGAGGALPPMLADELEQINAQLALLRRSPQPGSGAQG